MGTMAERSPALRPEVSMPTLGSLFATILAELQGGKTGPVMLWVHDLAHDYATAPMPPIARRVCGCGECDPGMPPECQPPG